MTTRSSLQSDAGIQLQVVIAIEGYNALLTSGSTSAALTAWAGTDWSTALGGLQLDSEFQTRLTPWQTSIEVGSISFAVMDDSGTGADTFGKAVFGQGAGAETYLRTAIDNNDTTVPCDTVSVFGNSGEVHIGTECIAYTAKTASPATLDTCTRGMYSPFRSGTTTRFGRYHPLPGIGDGQNTVTRPKVTSLPRVWRGRLVGIWLHKVTGGVLDTKANAQCIWAGRIKTVRDSTNGMTYVECEDIRSMVRDCVLLNDQWSGKTQEGIYLAAGWFFQAADEKAGTSRTATPLKVVTGAAGDYEMEAGIWTLSDIADKLNNWFTASRATGTELQLKWNFSPLVQTEDGLRSRFIWANGSVTSTNGVRFACPNANVQRFLGWGNNQSSFGGRWSGYHEWEDSQEQELSSPEVPRTTYLPSGFLGTVELGESRGTAFANQAYWPYEVDSGAGPTATGTYMVLRIGSGGPMAVFKLTDATTLQFSHSSPYLDAISGVPYDGDTWMNWREVTAEESTEGIRLTQVGIFGGNLLGLSTRFLASTGTSGYNHASYDTYPLQLGAAIPYELLGTTWTQSITAISDNGPDPVVVLEKPTKLSEVLGCELVIRLACFGLKPSSGGSWGTTGGILRAAVWGTPVSSQSSFTLTDSNKAVPAETSNELHRTVTEESDDAFVNVIKVEYGRVLSGGYRHTINVRAVDSIADVGHERAITISMRNTFEASPTSESSIEAIKQALLPAIRLFSQPLRKLTRTIDQSLFDGVEPGDMGSITDGFARDPSTGARGLSAKPCLLTSKHVDWGGYKCDSGQTSNHLGEVEVLILPIDNVPVYSPAALVDISQANGGYNAGTKVLTCAASEYTTTATADATRFAVGDRVRVIEVDPDDPAAAEYWEDVVAGQSGNTITLTTGLAGWTATKYHRVIPFRYTTSAAAQKLKAWQADDADSMIGDTVGPYVYGFVPTQGLDADGEETAVVDEPPALYSDLQYGDEKPFDVGLEHDRIRLVNNLVRYRTAPRGSTMNRTVKGSGSGYVTKITDVIPIFVGQGNLGSGFRYLHFYAHMYLSTGSTPASMFVTLCRGRPNGFSLTTTDSTDPQYSLVPIRSETYELTTSSTTEAVFTQENIPIIACSPITGIGYLVIEVEPTVRYRGVSWVVGPYQQSDDP